MICSILGERKRDDSIDKEKLREFARNKKKKRGGIEKVGTK